MCRSWRKISARRLIAAAALLALISLLVTMLLLAMRGRSSGTPVQINARNRVSRLRPFQPLLTSQELWIQLQLLQDIDAIFKHYNVTYFMYGGTLLGSYRHMGLIPWDDDIDILVNVSCRRQLPDMLQRMAPSLSLYDAVSHGKLSHRLSRQTSDFYWSWPYLDISYFAENQTHIWDTAVTYKRSFVFPKYLTLPTHPRPLEHLWLPAPRDTLAFLQLTYGSTCTCVTPVYSHMIEDRAESHRRPCQELQDKVAFVHRWPCSALAGSGSSSSAACVQETLRQGPLMLRSASVPEPAFAISDPFSLRLLDGFSQPAHYPNMSHIKQFY